MPNNVLNQLRTLRDGVAEELRRDPRYQTLQALDKSIAEITNVLAGAGLLPPGKSASSLSARLSGLAPSTEALAEPATAPQQQIAPPHAAPASPPPLEEPPFHAASAGTGFIPTPPPSEPMPPFAAETKPGFKDGTVSQAQAAVPEHQGASLQPTTDLATALIAGGVAAEFAHGHREEASIETAAPVPGDADGTQRHAATAPERDADFATEDALEAKDEIAEDAEDPASPGLVLDYTGVAHDEAEDARDAFKEDEHGEDDHGENEPGEADETPHARDAAAEPRVEAGPEAAPADLPPGEPHAIEHVFHAAMGDDGPAAAAHDETIAHAPLEASDDIAAEAAGDATTGYVPMAARAGAPRYAPSIAVKFGKLPSRVDLRPLMPPVEDQGELRSCVADAVAGAYEYWIKKATRKDHTVSRLFVYYNARWRDGGQDEDGGSAIQHAMEGLQRFGACADAVWPFDPQLVLEKPGADAYQDGAPYRTHDMAQVPLKLEAWKQALAEGKPIVFGIALFASFNECTTRGGAVPMPDPDDLARETHGVHALCAVGYSESEKVFIIRNCWGSEFGEAGYCYMPFDYVLNPKLNDGDCWVFVPKVPSQPPREAWQDDTIPLIGGGNEPAAQSHPMEDYQEVAVDLFETVRRPWTQAAQPGYSDYAAAVSKGHFAEPDAPRAAPASTAGGEAPAIASGFAGFAPSAGTAHAGKASEAAASDEDASETVGDHDGARLP